MIFSGEGFSYQNGTIRGMHFQEAAALEGKLMRRTKGSIFNVVIGLKPDSRSYGKWYRGGIDRRERSDAVTAKQLDSFVQFAPRGI